MSRSIDLNCDLGESYGLYKVGDNEEILRLVSSANIACGLHAGDFTVMHKTVTSALACHVAIGAHPGLPDLQGFGRRWIPFTPEEIYDLVLYQISALAGFVRAQGGRMVHVKPHGALYNRAAIDRPIANAIARAVRDFDPELRLFALSKSLLIEAGQAEGLRTVSEVFADRNYQTDGTLVHRSDPQAMIHSDEIIADRVLKILEHGTVLSLDGQEIPLLAETICLHGDEKEALSHAHTLHQALKKNGILIQAV